MAIENTLPPALNDDEQAAASVITAMYAPVANEMQRVEQTLKIELRSEFKVVDEMLRHGSMLGGKRLRPALLLLAARLFGPPKDEHITLAAVVEMIHTATLIHDDVLDEASQRRHIATCNAIWDNEASVLLGDYLFTHAFYLASTTGSARACQFIGAATNTVCEGELRQVRSRGDFQLSEEQYFAIIEAKTARLCQCSCELGAHFADATTDEARSLAAYGRHLGIAFQITDDLLDLLGSDETTGKSLGTDLAQQKFTLPIIRALGQCSAAQRTELVEILQDDQHRSLSQRQALLRSWIQQFDAIEFARQAAARHVAAACEQLSTLPAGEARDILGDLPQFVLIRSA